MPAPEVNTPTVTTLSTAAASEASRCGSAAWTKNSGPRSLTSWVFVHAASVICPMGWASALAALLTTRSIPPYVATVPSTTRSRSPRSPVLAGMASACPPSAMIAAAVASQAAAFRLETTTFAPHEPSAMAIARPIPREPPVTMATLPSRSNLAFRSSLLSISPLLRCRGHLDWHPGGELAAGGVDLAPPRRANRDRDPGIFQASGELRHLRRV